MCPELSAARRPLPFRVAGWVCRTLAEGLMAFGYMMAPVMAPPPAATGAPRAGGMRQDRVPPWHPEHCVPGAPPTAAEVSLWAQLDQR